MGGWYIKIIKEGGKEEGVRKWGGKEYLVSPGEEMHKQISGFLEGGRISPNEF